MRARRPGNGTFLRPANEDYCKRCSVTLFKVFRPLQSVFSPFPSKRLRSVFHSQAGASCVPKACKHVRRPWRCQPFTHGLCDLLQLDIDTWCRWFLGLAVDDRTASSTRRMGFVAVVLRSCRNFCLRRYCTQPAMTT